MKRKTKRQRQDEIAGLIVGVPRNITRVGLTSRELVALIRTVEASEIRPSKMTDFFVRAKLVKLNQGGFMLALIRDNDVAAIRAQVRAARRGVLSRILAAWGTR